MEENLEIYFCEICNESIPAKDLRTRTAIEFKGKVIGPCCLPGMQRTQARGGMSSVGLTTLGAIVLAAIAGATMHLEWRLSEEVSRLQGRIANVETNVASTGTKQIADFERALDGTLRSGELKPLADRLDDIDDKSGRRDARLDAKFGGLRAQLEGLDEAQRRIISGQAELRGDVKDVESEVMRLERDVANAVAVPRGYLADASAGENPARRAPARGPAKSAPGLPAALAHQVSRLKDGDAGNRFEAVDQLIQSKNLAVVEHLVPMLKDSDAFVRRLTAEGLAGFHDKRAVEGLLVALADPESIVRHTAYTSLKKLTGQLMVFDPEGSPSARGQQQRRFKDWWEKAKEKF